MADQLHPDIWGHPGILCGFSNFRTQSQPQPFFKRIVNTCETTAAGITIRYDGWTDSFNFSMGRLSWCWAEVTWLLCGLSSYFKPLTIGLYQATFNKLLSTLNSIKLIQAIFNQILSSLNQRVFPGTNQFLEIFKSSFFLKPLVFLFDWFAM